MDINGQVRERRVNTDADVKRVMSTLIYARFPS